MSLNSEAQIGKTILRVIGETTSNGLPKIEAEFTRQLDAILGGAQRKEAEALRAHCSGGLSLDTAVKMKRVMSQLFLHLQRALVLNIAQNLSEHLTTLINEIAGKAAYVDAENEKLNNDVTHLREKLSDLSERVKEYETRPGQHGKTNEESQSLNLDEISIGVDRLISQTRQATNMLTGLSKKYLELREENKELRQINATQ